MSVRSTVVQIVGAFAIAAIAVFFGMFLPFPTDGAVHNPLWELIFGIGFWVAELFPHATATRRRADRVSGVVRFDVHRSMVFRVPHTAGRTKAISPRCVVSASSR